MTACGKAVGVTTTRIGVGVGLMPGSSRETPKPEGRDTHDSAVTTSREQRISIHGSLLQRWILLSFSMWWVNLYTSEGCANTA
jgi:hypothetical protein